MGGRRASCNRHNRRVEPCSVPALVVTPVQLPAPEYMFKITADPSRVLKKLASA